MFATLIVRITLISRFFFCIAKFARINVSRNFHVIRYSVLWKSYKKQFRQQANSSQADETLEKWKNRVEKMYAKMIGNKISVQNPYKKTF